MALKHFSDPWQTLKILTVYKKEFIQDLIMYFINILATKKSKKFKIYKKNCSVFESTITLANNYMVNTIVWYKCFFKEIINNFAWVLVQYLVLLDPKAGLLLDSNNPMIISHKINQ